LKRNHIFSGGINDSEKSIILRSTTPFQLRNILFSSIYSEAGGYTTAFSPVMLFLNGKTWGIYMLHERIDEQYFKKKFGSAKYDFIKDKEIWDNNSHSFKEIIEWFSTNDLKENENLEKANSLVDIDNFTDYWLFNIYAANYDWPYNNMVVFKNIDAKDEPWRTVSWDVDDSFGNAVGHEKYANYDNDTLKRTTMDEEEALGIGYDEKRRKFLIANIIVNKLLDNKNYKDKFVKRFCDLMNFYLFSEKVHKNFDKIVEVTKYDRLKDLERWSHSEYSYKENVEAIKTFINKRPYFLYESFRKKFGLGNPTKIVLFCEPNLGGKIFVNTIAPDGFPWHGKYFENLSITLNAVPSNNYKFVRWSEPSLGTNPKIDFTVKKSFEIGAIFEPINKTY